MLAPYLKNKVLGQIIENTLNSVESALHSLNNTLSNYEE